MKIVLSSDDLLKGVYSDQQNCPIALALQRSYPDKWLWVTTSGVTLGGNEFTSKNFYIEGRFDYKRYRDAVEAATKDHNYTLELELNPTC
jgi:hypothetical protein